MRTLLDYLRKVESPKNIPIGEYSGTWSGYVVRFVVPSTGESYEARSEIGIRGTTEGTVLVTADGIEFRSK